VQDAEQAEKLLAELGHTSRRLRLELHTLTLSVRYCHTRGGHVGVTLPWCQLGNFAAYH
jgi:hypothetical protein